MYEHLIEPVADMIVHHLFGRSFTSFTPSESGYGESLAFEP